MNEVTQRPGGIVEHLPMADDRTDGWRALRQLGDVVKAEDTYVMVSGEAVEFATKHPELFSSKAAFDQLGSPLPLVPIAIDPPDHARYRRILDPFFGPKRMGALDTELRAQAGRIIDELAVRGSCDIVPDLANLYPTQVFLTLFGLPLEDRERLIAWKDSILELTDPTSTEPSSDLLTHAVELYEYLSRYVTERRAGAGADLLTQLLASRDEGGMTDEEIIGLCYLFVLAGLDTVASALGFSFATLGADPALRSQLVDHPESIPDFIEEILRVEVPVPFSPRVTTQDVSVAGVEIPAGSPVLISYGAANRDPRRHDHPDQLDPTSAGRHYAFGGGPHRCLGSHLARLEMRVVLEEWHRRIPDYELAGDPPKARWPAGTLGLTSVRLRYDARSNTH
jgi:cytochrome P450